MGQSETNRLTHTHQLLLFRPPLSHPVILNEVKDLASFNSVTPYTKIRSSLRSS